MRENRGIRRLFGNHHRSVAILVALLLVTGLITAPPAHAAVESLTLTVSASDLGIDPSALAEAVNGINAKDAADNTGLIEEAGRWTGEYGTSGAAAASVPANFEVTASMTADGTGVTFSVPAADVQANQTDGQLASGLLLSAIFGLLIRGICITSLTLSGVGAAAIPVICTPLGSALGAFFQGIWQHYWDNDLGTWSAWADILIKVAGAIFVGYTWEKWLSPFFKTTFPTFLSNTATWIKAKLSTWFALMWGSAFGNGMLAIANGAIQLGENLPGAVASYDASLPAAGPLPCDVYEDDNAACTASYSTVRALFSYYSGPLYQVQRASDNATADIGLLSTGGYVDASQQDNFCNGTTCTITKVYDQSPQENDLTVEGAGGAAGADGPASATALSITVNGHKAYGIDFTGQIGYRDNNTTGIAVNGEPEGMYMVASGTHVNDGCCFDFGNAETNTRDNGNGHMDAVNFSTTCYFPPCTGNGPWVEADMENGLFQGGNGSNTANTGLIGDDFVTAMLKNDGQSDYSLRGGNAQSGGLSTWWDGGLPNPAPSGYGYKPMQQEGAIVLGTGGDNSNWAVGSFFEGVMTAGYPTDAADAAVQDNIVSAGYTGDSGGSGSAAGVTPSAAGPAVVHTAGATGAAASGFSSVYTVDSADGHLQESYLPNMGADWSTQDLSAKYGTPAVMPGTSPVSIVHCGYTSVYTVDAANGDLQETYLPAIGSNWTTQDLSANYGTPPTDETPTALVHSAGATGSASTCGFTSVYTVDRNGDLQETYLPVLGDNWTTQDLSTSYGTPQIQPGTAPVAIVHCGYSSVYTVDAASHDLQETFLQGVGTPWHSQDLSAAFGTPTTDTTPSAVVHSQGASGATAACGFTSVYTVDESNRHLDETYLPNAGFPGDPWITQDLSAKYGTPGVAPGTAPVALVHMNFTSVYTVDQGSDQVQETYLDSIGNPWKTQSLSADYGTPATDQTPIVLLHPDVGGNLDWTSVYTINELNNDLQETYLSNTGFPGNAWVTQDLSAKYGTPTVAVQQSSQSSWTVDHAGYTSVYTVDGEKGDLGDLQETYLPAMGANWATQDLTSQTQSPGVAPNTTPSALYHDGFDSVYTVAEGSGDLQETYLRALGDTWLSQDLTKNAGTPVVMPGTSPSSLFHDGYDSVYTVDADGELQETYLPAAGFPGDAWHTQSLSLASGTPRVLPGSSPVAIFHDGYTSVFTIDANGDLQETYLSAMGGKWISHDLSLLYQTPETLTTPTAVFHDGYLSVYTVDGSGDLQETYLPAIGDLWSTQDLTNIYHVPAAEQGWATPIPTAPVALYHTGYTSVYYLDKSNGDVDEAYLPAISGGWSSQDLSAVNHFPGANWPVSPLVHYAANGGLTWTSVFSIDQQSEDLRETFLPGIGGNWTTKDLSSTAQTPPW